MSYSRHILHLGNQQEGTCTGVGYFHLVGEIDCFGKCSIGKGVLGRDIVDITHLSHT